MPPEVESAVTELISISGKSRDECIRALAAAQNVPDIAFEFLISGYIPPVDAAGAGGQPAGGDDPYGQEDVGADAGAGGGMGGYNLDPEVIQRINTLVNNPSFPMIR